MFEVDITLVDRDLGSLDILGFEHLVILDIENVPLVHGKPLKNLNAHQTIFFFVALLQNIFSQVCFSGFLRKAQIQPPESTY